MVEAAGGAAVVESGDCAVANPPGGTVVTARLAQGPNRHRHGRPLTGWMATGSGDGRTHLRNLLQGSVQAERMAQTDVSAFADALERHEVTLVRTTPAAFSGDLSSAVTEPAVGAALPHPLDYAGTPVEPDPSVAAIEAATTGVTPVSLGIANYGSVVVSGTEDGEEPVSLFVEHHVAVLRASDLVADMPAAIDELGAAIREGHGDNVVATGPSATADMGDLVLGVHGPKRVTVLLVEDEEASGEDIADGDGTVDDPVDGQGEGDS